MAKFQEPLRRGPKKAENLAVVERGKGGSIAAEDTTQRPWQSTEASDRKCPTKVPRNPSRAATKEARRAREATAGEAPSRHEFHQIRTRIRR
jgi:hypothetical protein